MAENGPCKVTTRTYVTRVGRGGFEVFDLTTCRCPTCPKGINKNPINSRWYWAGTDLTEEIATKEARRAGGRSQYQLRKNCNAGNIS